MLKKYFLLLPMCLLTISVSLSGLQVGSPYDFTVEETKVSLSGTDNSIETLAFIEQGFTFYDAATTVSFNSIFPVEGSLELNGGSLYLQRDMNLANTGMFTTGGNVYGNNKAILLPHSSQIVKFPVGYSPSNFSLDLVTRMGTVNDSASSGAPFAWSYDGKYVAFTEGANNINIYSFDQNGLQFVTYIEGDGPVTLQWHPSQYVLFATSYNSASNFYRFYPGQDAYIEPIASIPRTDNEVFVYTSKWSPDGTKVALVTLELSGEDYYFLVRVFLCDPQGDVVLKSQVTITPRVEYIVSFAPKFGPCYAGWDLSSSYLTIGISQAYIYSEFDLSTLVTFHDSDNDTVFVMNTDIPSPGSTDITALDVRATDNNATIFAVGTNRGGFLYKHDINAGTMTQVGSFADSQLISSLGFNHEGSLLTVGDDSFLVKCFQYDASLNSLVPFKTLSIDYNAPAYTLWSLQGALGVITFINSVSFLSIYQPQSSKDFTFDNTALAFHSDVVMTGTCAFNGTCMLNGGGKVLDLSATGQMVINRNSVLSLNNLIIRGLGLQSNQFMFQDESSVLKLSNVIIEVDNSLTTSAGSIYVDGPLSVAVDGFVWRIDETMTLTIDGVTLWQDNGGVYQAGGIDVSSPSLELLNLGGYRRLSDASLEAYESEKLASLLDNMCDCTLANENLDAMANLVNTVELFSDTYNQLIIDTSDVIVSLSENNCDCTLIVDNCNAIINLAATAESLRSARNQLIVEHSNAIVQLGSEIENVANVSDYHGQLIRHNSFAIVSLSESSCDCTLITDNSNAIVHVKGIIEAIDTLNNGLLVQNSDAIVALIENECECSLIIEQSDTIANLVDRVAALKNVNNQLILDNSNALVSIFESVENIDDGGFSTESVDDMSTEGIGSDNDQLIRDTSDAIIALSENICDCDLIVDNSNAIIVWATLTQNTSSAVVSTPVTVHNQLVIDTSNALLSFIGCQPLCDDIIITTTTWLDKSMFIQPHQRIVIMGDVTLDGGGAMIVFAAPLVSQFVVRSGSTLRLRNIELLNLHATTLDLQKGATLIIERGALFELAEDITLSQGLLRIDDTPNKLVVRSKSKGRLTLKPRSFHFAPSQIPVLLDLGSNALMLENIDLVGLEYVAHNSALEDLIIVHSDDTPNSIEIELATPVLS